MAVTITRCMVNRLLCPMIPGIARIGTRFGGIRLIGFSARMTDRRIKRVRLAESHDGTQK